MIATVTAATLRDSATTALQDYQVRSQEQARLQATEGRRRNAERLREYVVEFFGIEVPEIEVEWPEANEWDNDRANPTITIDGVRFREGRIGDHWRLYAEVPRHGCGHVLGEGISRQLALMDLGRLLDRAATTSERCGRCDQEAFDGRVERGEIDPDRTAPAPPPPSLADRLDALVREIVRDELWRREEGA